MLINLHISLPLGVILFETFGLVCSILRSGQLQKMHNTTDYYYHLQKADHKLYCGV